MALTVAVLVLIAIDGLRSGLLGIVRPATGAEHLIATAALIYAGLALIAAGALASRSMASRRLLVAWAIVAVATAGAAPIASRRTGLAGGVVAASAAALVAWIVVRLAGWALTGPPDTH